MATRRTVVPNRKLSVPLEPQETAVTIRLAPGGGLEWDEFKRLKASGGGGPAVTSVNTKTGDVVLAAADVGALSTQAGAVATASLANKAVTDAKLGDSSVGTPHIKAEAVTVPKLGTDVIARILKAQGAKQADSTAADVAALVTDFNALLAKLRTAGVIAT